MKRYLGIDIGGSSIKYGVGSCEQGLLFFGSIPVCEKSLHGFRKLFTEIFNHLKRGSLLTDLHGIGIGSPGMIDHRLAKIVGTNPNLPFWTDIAPDALIPVEIKLPCVFDNDANLMALAEAQYFDASHNVIGLTIGSGIGSGFVCKRNIFHGSRGFAMELGHVTVVHNGELCNCGKRGCLEAYASLNGMRNRLCHLGLEAQQWNLLDLLQRAESNPIVKQILEQGLEQLALALANLILILEPDHLVIGGGASELPEYPSEELKAMIAELLPQHFYANISVDKARLGNKAGVLGAIALAEMPIKK